MRFLLQTGEKGFAAVGDVAREAAGAPFGRNRRPRRRCATRFPFGPGIPPGGSWRRRGLRGSPGRMQPRQSSGRPCARWGEEWTGGDRKGVGIHFVGIGGGGGGGREGALPSPAHP